MWNVRIGQISAQRCILEVKPFKSKYSAGVDAYIEEAVIRRELSDNFCFYNPNYDNITGAAGWAQQTLDVHKYLKYFVLPIINFDNWCLNIRLLRNDKRTPLLTAEQLETSKTHDDLWNASQLQLVQTGKMHGFLRVKFIFLLLQSWSFARYVLTSIRCTGQRRS